MTISVVFDELVSTAEAGLRGLQTGTTRRRSVPIVEGYVLPNTCPDPQPVDVASGTSLPTEALGKTLTFEATTTGVTGFACTTTAGGLDLPAGLILSYTVSSGAPPTLKPVGGPAPTNGTIVANSVASSTSQTSVIAGASGGAILLALLAGVAYYYHTMGKKRQDSHKEQTRGHFGQTSPLGDDLEGRLSVAPGVELQPYLPRPAGGAAVEDRQERLHPTRLSPGESNPMHESYSEEEAEDTADASPQEDRQEEEREGFFQGSRAQLTGGSNSRGEGVTTAQSKRMSAMASLNPQPLRRDSVQRTTATTTENKRASVVPGQLKATALTVETTAQEESESAGDEAWGFARATKEELALYPLAPEEAGFGLPAPGVSSPLHSETERSKPSRHKSMTPHGLNPMHSPAAPQMMHPARLPVVAGSGGRSSVTGRTTLSPEDDPSTWEFCYDEDTMEEFWYNSVTEVSTLSKPECLSQHGAPETKRVSRKVKKGKRRGSNKHVASL